MKFSNITQIKKAYEVIKKEQLRNRAAKKHYPVAFKKAVCQAIERGDVNYSQVIKQTDILPGSLSYWKEQYEKDLFTMKGSYSVSQKSLKTNNSILAKLQQQKAEIQERIELIERCEELGLKVTG